MKKLFTAIAIFAASTSAFAGFQTVQKTQESYQSGKKQTTVKTVAQAKRAYDDTYITLRGNIIRKLSKESYLFKDSTGTIRVEIDDDMWRGLVVSPKDKVTLYGKVDRDDGRVEIDVKHLSK